MIHNIIPRCIPFRIWLYMPKYHTKSIIQLYYSNLIIIFCAGRPHLMKSAIFAVLSDSFAWPHITYQLLGVPMDRFVLPCQQNGAYLKIIPHCTEWRYQNFDRNWYWDFFSETKYSETETETFFRDQIFRNRYRNPQRFGISFETEKFRNRNVNLSDLGLG